MERRDAAEKQYKEDGKRPVIQHTNKGGATNWVKNPMLVIMNECDQQALAYWRDLGLTPSGFKKLGNEMISIKKEASFEDLLANIGI